MRIQPVNFERHRHTLENAIHRKIGDIALVLQLIICEGNPDNLTMQLSRNRIMTWERTEDQLIMEAFMNSSRKMPPEISLQDRPLSLHYEGGSSQMRRGGRQRLLHGILWREGLDTS